MKKKRILCLIAIVLFISGFWVWNSRRGHTWGAEHIMGESIHYTAAEIEAAMKTVERKFRADYTACTLLSLTYDEAWSNGQGAQVKKQEGEDVIVLLSDFYVPETGAEGCWNPDDTYTDWQWILTRSDGGDWQFRDAGYG